MEKLDYSRQLAGVLLFGAPITYILAVVHTWNGTASVMVKLLICLTLDVFLAAIWPITWIFWIAFHLFGQNTPLRLLLG